MYITSKYIFLHFEYYFWAFIVKNTQKTRKKWIKMYRKYFKCMKYFKMPAMILLITYSFQNCTVVHLFMVLLFYMDLFDGASYPSQYPWFFVITEQEGRLWKNLITSFFHNIHHSNCTGT